MEGVAGTEDEDEEGSNARETDDDSEDSRRAGLSPGEASAADTRESLLPPLSRSPAARRTPGPGGGGRIADAMRAWGRAAAADARACVRAACVAAASGSAPSRGSSQSDGAPRTLRARAVATG